MTDDPQQPMGQSGQPAQAGDPAPYGVPTEGTKFGTSSYEAGGAYGQPMAEPKSWARLKMLTLVSFAIHVIASVVSIFGMNEEVFRESTVATLEAQGMSASEEAVEQTVAFSMAVGIGTLVASIVLGVILYLVVFSGLRRGKNWARILGTILAVIGALYNLFGFMSIGATLSVAPIVGVITVVLSALFIIVNVWWIVAAFSKSSSAYVRSNAGA